MHKPEQRRVAGVSPVNDRHEKKAPPASGGIQLRAKVLIHRSPETSYQYWRNFENLPSTLRHLKTVEVIDDRRSHWVVNAPADTTLEWDAEIIEDIPHERISWRSLDNAQIDNAGSVHFVPRSNGQETEMKVTMTYNPPLGKIGAWFSKLFGEDPQDQLKEDLERFKTAMEGKD
jgi:uncharacterized membrane protein